MRAFMHAITSLVGLLVFQFVFQACNSQPETADVLTVDLKLSENLSPFGHSLSSASKYDTTLNNIWSRTLQPVIGVPDTLIDANLYYDNLQIRQLVFYGFKAGLMDTSYYESWTENAGFLEEDYTDQFVDQQVHFVYGLDADSNHVLIFDTNNNENLGDERAHVLPKKMPDLPWFMMDTHLVSVPVTYDLFDGERIVTATTKITVHPYMKSPIPGMRPRLWRGGFAHTTGTLQYKEKTYGWWAANPGDVGAYTALQARVWVEPIDGTNVPAYTGRQEALLQENLADTSADKPNYPAGVYPKLKEPFEVGDLISLGEDVFELSSISPAGDQIVLNRAEAKLVGLRTGLTAPDFEGQALDSTTVRLSDYRGRYVLIDFWGTWCGPCLGEVPHLKAAYESYDRDQFDILAVAYDDPEALRVFIEKENLTWTQIIQQEEDSTMRDILDVYRITGYPTTFLVDPEGVIVAREGRLRGDNLSKTLARHIGP